jgi:CheY-like chemotaxis protein
MRFIADGDACACKTALQDLGSGSHFSYMRVRWPDDISRVRVRKHGRVSARVPCKVTKAGETEHMGELDDISVGGCKIFLDAALPKGSVITLAFTLPDGSYIDGLEATVASCIPETAGMSFGCQFSDPDEAILNDIEFFVATSLARLRGTSSTRPRVLILDRDVEHAGELKMALRDHDYEVTLAVGVVDGFFALRLAPPAMLLADMQQIGLTAVEVCRAVRAMRQFKELPTLVYGGSAADQKNVMEAGATQWFSSSDNVKEILSVVERLVPPPPPAPASPGES